MHTIHTIEDYIKAGEFSPHRIKADKTDEQIVNEAIDLLVDNLFTGADVARFITADNEMIEKALEKKFYPNGHNVNPKRKPRKETNEK